jgi:hypothetical protein
MNDLWRWFKREEHWQEVKMLNNTPDCVKSQSIHQKIGFSPHRTGRLRREIGTAQAERPGNWD